MALQEVARLLEAAIEASVYITPSEPGLTHAELHEIGARLDLRQGEINDALSHGMTHIVPGKDRRLTLQDNLLQIVATLAFEHDPELRNPAAFDFVVAQLNLVIRTEGTARARLDRSVMLERAQTESIPRHDVEVAIALNLLCGLLIEENGVIRWKSTRGGERPLPSRGLPGVAGVRHPKKERSKAYDHVKNVIERRSDGRQNNVEALTGFPGQLEKLGYGHFRLWWNQTAGELRRTDTAVSPLSALVLSAALVEGALTFVVKHARTLGAFGSSDFERAEVVENRQVGGKCGKRWR